MKKLFAGFLAAILAAVVIIPASAASTTTDLGESDGTGWWVNHTAGVKVEEGATVTITADVTQYAAAEANNWFGPLYVAYSASEAKVNGADYVEYFVGRGDNYGWASDANTGEVIDGTKTSAVIASFTRNSEPNWDNFATELKAGIKYTVTATISGSQLTVVSETSNGAKNTAVLNVDATKDVYVSLFCEQAKATNIKATVTTADAPATTTVPQTGESLAIIGVSLIGLIALAVLVVENKKANA